MILVDTGPLVALFDPKDGQHQWAAKTLRTLRERLCTTVPVLTESFHMLQPQSIGSDRLREFVARAGLTVWFLDRVSVTRAFELMEQYVDHPMNLADASVIAAAEVLKTRKVFTLDKANFAAYRIRRGHRHQSVDVID